MNQLVVLGIGEAKTISDYISRIRIVMERINCDDLIKCINNYDKFEKDLESVKKPNGSSYSINTLRAYFDTVVYVIDHLHLKISTEASRRFHEIKAIYKTDSGKYHDDKQAREVIPKFQAYENKVIQTFGEDSEMHLITLLYKETEGARDNFGLIIVKNRDEVNYNKENNYIVVPPVQRGMEPENMTIVIEQFKTNKKYVGYDLELSPELSNKLRQYIKDKKRKYGSYLFGREKLSSVISNANKKMEYNKEGEESIGAVNLFRKMLASAEEYNKLTTPEQQKIADRFKHSIEIHKKYLRQN